MPLKRNSLCVPSIVLLTFYGCYTLRNKLNRALPLHWEYAVSGSFTKNFIWRIMASKVKLIMSSDSQLKRYVWNTEYLQLNAYEQALDHSSKLFNE